MQFVARFNILVLKLLWQQEEEDWQTMVNFSEFVELWFIKIGEGLAYKEEYKERPTKSDTAEKNKYTSLFVS